MHAGLGVGHRLEPVEHELSFIGGDDIADLPDVASKSILEVGQHRAIAGGGVENLGDVGEPLGVKIDVASIAPDYRAEELGVEQLEDDARARAARNNVV